MEVLTYPETEADGVWLVEESKDKLPQLAVARAVVNPSLSKFPVRVLNVSEEPVTYAGAIVATMQHVEAPVTLNTVASTVADDTKDEEKQETLWGIVRECSTELSPEEREIFYNLLLKNADVMASSTEDLGRTNKLCHHIDTGQAAPIRKAVRRISPHRQEEVKRLLDQMLKQGVVQPSSSPWASPVVLVKKDGSTRH